jgi:hypothetical protein
VYADFPALEAEPQPSDLLFVEVKVKYGDMVKMHTWDATGSGENSENGGRWEVSWHKIPDVSQVEWEARLVYREPGHDTIIGPERTDKTEINIPVRLPGRALLRMAQSGVPWEMIQHVEVEVNYRDAKADPQNLVKRYLYKQDSDEVSLNEVIWTQRKEPFFVKLLFMLKNGNTIEEGPYREESDLFVIDTPFKDIMTVRFQARHMNDDFKQDIVLVEYRDEANEYVREGELYLSSESDGGTFQTWSIPLLNKDQATFRYKWMRQGKSGSIFTSADYTGAPADGWQTATGTDLIFTGHPDIEIGDMLVVTVDPFVFLLGDLGDGKQLMRAVVHLQRDGSTDVDDLVFTPAATGLQPLKWREFLQDPTNKKYRWSAEYLTMPFSRIKIGPYESTEETLVLEPPEAYLS